MNYVTVWPRHQHKPTSLVDRPLLILLHGYGSNELDLASLAPYLTEEIAIVTLRAPLTMQTGSYTWFPITTPGNPDPAAVQHATQFILDWLDAEILPLNPKNIAIAGFSMGGAMSIELMRARPQQFCCAGNLSGFAVGGRRLLDAELAASKPPLFWGHDPADPIITPAAVAQTAEFVPQHFSLRYKRYPDIQHSISQAELDDFNQFLVENLLENPRIEPQQV